MYLFNPKPKICILNYILFGTDFVSVSSKFMDLLYVF